jgi:hypothetical protein
MYIYIWYTMVHLKKYPLHHYVIVKTKSFCHKFVKINKEIFCFYAETTIIRQVVFAL